MSRQFIIPPKSISTCCIFLQPGPSRILTPKPRDLERERNSLMDVKHQWKSFTCFPYALVLYILKNLRDSASQVLLCIFIYLKSQGQRREFGRRFGSVASMCFRKIKSNMAPIQRSPYVVPCESAKCYFSTRENNLRKQIPDKTWASSNEN